MTLGTAPHPVTESRRQVFFFFSFLSFCLWGWEKVGFSRLVYTCRVCGVGAGSVRPVSMAANAVQESEQSQHKSDFNGATLASARGQQEAWRLGKGEVHSGAWLKGGQGQRLEGGAGDGVELLHQPFQTGHLLGKVILFIHLKNSRGEVNMPQRAHNQHFTATMHTRPFKGLESQ